MAIFYTNKWEKTKFFLTQKCSWSLGVKLKQQQTFFKIALSIFYSSRQSCYNCRRCTMVKKSPLKKVRRISTPSPNICLLLLWREKINNLRFANSVAEFLLQYLNWKNLGSKAVDHSIKQLIISNFHAYLTYLRKPRSILVASYMYLKCLKERMLFSISVLALVWLVWCKWKKLKTLDRVAFAP